MLWSHPVPHPCCSCPVAGEGMAPCPEQPWSGLRTGMSLRAGTGSVVPERGGATPGQGATPTELDVVAAAVDLALDGDRDP